MTPEKHTAPIVEPEKETPGLDLSDPMKWQMKIRLHIEELSAADADAWLEGFRLNMTVAGRIVRDLANIRAGKRCAICEKPFKNGRPEAEASFLDADRERVKLYACDQSEYSDLLKLVHQKEEAIEMMEVRAERAARQAAKDARSASYRKDTRV